MRALAPLIAAAASTRRRSTRFYLAVLTGFLLVSGAAMLLLYALSSRVLEQETVSLHRALLEQASRSMDSSLLQIDAFVQQLAIDPYLANVPEYYRRGDFATLLRINEDLNNLRIINSHVQSTEVFFRPTRQVFIPNTGVLGLDSVADASFLLAVEQGSIKEGWQAARTIRDPQSDKDVPVVSVVKFLRQGSVESDAFIVVNIGEDSLRALVGVLKGAQDTELLITDGAAQPIARLSALGYFESLRGLPAFARSIADGNGSLTLQGGGTRFLVTVVRGTLQDWRYVNILPFPAITARIRFLQTWSLLVIVLGLLASLAVAVFFSRRLNTLLRQILLRTVPGGSADGAAAAGAAGGENDPLAAIESSLAFLQAQARELERSLEAHLPVLRNNALESLFKGRLAGGAEQRETLRAYGLSLGERRTYVALLATLSEESMTAAGASAERDLAALRIVDMIRKAVPPEDEFAAAFTRDDEIAMLLGTDAPPDGVADDVARRVGEQFGPAGGTPVVLGMSAPHEGLDSVPLAYREARRAARSAASPARPIVRYEEVDQGVILYPFDEETDLVDALKKGDAAAVEHASAVFEQALAGKATPYHHLHLLSSILKAAHDLGIAPSELFPDANPYLGLTAAAERGGVSRYLQDVFARVIERVRMRKASRNRVAAERVAAYVRAHYAEELGLPVLARLVYMSGPYLSRVFHEEMKVSLRHFIGSVRIARACELLHDPGLKVGEVGRRVGYARSRGFLKFFKEQVGMTPLEYRVSLGGGSPGSSGSSATSSHDERRGPDYAHDTPAEDRLRERPGTRL